jgi:putative sterol carrier protein
MNWTLHCPSRNQTNGIFELQVSNEAKETATWTIDVKKVGTVYKGKAQPKADVTIILSDDTLIELSEGKVRRTLNDVPSKGFG